MHYTILWIRKDLSVVNQIIQTGHAAHLAGQHFPIGGSRFVLFQVRDIIELEEIESLLKSNNIKYIGFNETEIYDNNSIIGLSSIATEPISKEQKKLFKKCKLYKDKN